MALSLPFLSLMLKLPNDWGGNGRVLFQQSWRVFGENMADIKTRDESDPMKKPFQMSAIISLVWYGVPCRQDGISGMIDRKTSCLISKVSQHNNDEIIPNPFQSRRRANLSLHSSLLTNRIDRSYSETVISYCGKCSAALVWFPHVFSMGSSFSSD